MKKLIAKINIYQDDEVEGAVSETVGEKEYSVSLNPSVDLKAFNREVVKKANSLEEKGFIEESILAHELGHIVAHIFSDPTHNKTDNFIAQMFGDGSVVIPAERRAWKIAHSMRLPLSKEAEEVGIASYKS